MKDKISNATTALEQAVVLPKLLLDRLFKKRFGLIILQEHSLILVSSFPISN